MAQGDWKQDAKDMGFERFPQLTKSGVQTFKFLDEGKTVPARTTGFKDDSVVFKIEVDGETKELWMSKMHPMLRALADKKNLTGHSCTIDFGGKKGLEMRAEVKEFK